MGQLAEKYILRLPFGMRNRIRANADANRRSMNSEIVHYLDRALAAEDRKRVAATFHFSEDTIEDCGGSAHG